MQKIWDKLGKLRKSCNHQRNINGIYSEPTAIPELKTSGIWEVG